MDAKAPVFSPVPSEPVPTYHGQAAIKPSVYGWTVALYIYVAGLAAGLQIIVTAAQLLAIPGGETVSFAGRGIALLGAVIGGILLIIDLHTKQRFYNMLRIFRPTSPMSIGTYLLIGFGFSSLVSFMLQAFDLRWSALIFGCLAAATGWGMTTYTAALLAATATPLWAGSPKLLAVRFASSAMATGGASACLLALALAPASGLTRAFGNFTGIALVVELAGSFGWQMVLRRIGIAGPLDEMPWGSVHAIAVELVGDIAPIILFFLANFFTSNWIFTVTASFCVLIGGLLLRATIIFAGNKSACLPQDYFRFAKEVAHG